MPRAGEQDRTPIDYESIPHDKILAAEVESVTIQLEESKWPTFEQDNRKTAFCLDVVLKPEGHPFSLRAITIPVRISLDNDGDVIINDYIKGLDQSERSNIPVMHKLFDTLGYKGGIASSGDWMNAEGDIVSADELQDEIDDALMKIAGTKPVLVYVLKRESKDGRIFINGSARLIAPNNPNGMKDMKKAFAKELKAVSPAATDPSTKAPPRRSI